MSTTQNSLSCAGKESRHWLVSKSANFLSEMFIGQRTRHSHSLCQRCIIWVNYSEAWSSKFNHSDECFPMTMDKLSVAIDILLFGIGSCPLSQGQNLYRLRWNLALGVQLLAAIVVTYMDPNYVTQYLSHFVWPELKTNTITIFSCKKKPERFCYYLSVQMVIV